MTLLNTFLHNLSRYSLLPHLRDRVVLVAVSGGADSLCLAHLLQRSQPQTGIRALHIATLDHGLRGQAGQEDAQFVCQIGAQWGVPVHHARRDVPAIAASCQLGVEEAARLTRYTYLSTAAREIHAQTIAVGHHADDQAETLLMHLIRGTGLAGLRGMQPVTPLSDQHLLPGEIAPSDLAIIRPLLHIPRRDIEAYCAAHNLTPREDATNTDTTYLRNWVRHDLLPQLARHNPQISTTISQTAAVLSDDYTKLSSVTQAALTAITRAADGQHVRLDRAVFRAIDPDPSGARAIQRGILRAVVRQLGPPAAEVSFATIEQALAIAQMGDTGQQATLPGGILLTVEADALTIRLPDAPLAGADRPRLAPGSVLAVNLPGITPLPDSGWELHARWLQQDDSPDTWFGQPYTAVLTIPKDAALVLRTRRAGDRFAPLGLHGHTRKLKDVLIDLKIPAAERDHIPLLMINELLAWLPLPDSGRINTRLAVSPANRSVAVFQWQRKNKQ
jgi:tRNA(Ile)-lysidine synthase